MNNDFIKEYNSSKNNYHNSGLQTYFANIYQYVALGLLLCGAVSFAIANSPTVFSMIFGTPLGLLSIFGCLGLSIYLNARINTMSLATAQTIYWSYVFLTGISLSYVFVLYTTSSVANAFLTTSGIFIGASLYGRTTSGDLSRFSNIIFVGLIGVIISSVINMFLRSSQFDMLISAVSILVMTALIAYQNQALQSIYYMRSSQDEKDKIAIIGAMSLFIAFVNIFLNILRLMGNRRSD